MTHATVPSTRVGERVGGNHLLRSPIELTFSLSTGATCKPDLPPRLQAWNHDQVATVAEDRFLGGRILMPGSHQVRRRRFSNLMVNGERNVDLFGATDLRALTDKPLARRREPI